LNRPPSTTSELTGGLITPDVTTALGSALGTGLTIETGPGALVGGAIGAIGGRLLYDNLDDMLESFGLIQRGGRGLRDLEPAQQVPSVAQRVASARAEGTADLMFAGAGAAVRPILRNRTVWAKILGITSEGATALRNRADNFGIGLGALDVGGSIPRSYAKVASVFPFTGGPLRSAFITKQAQARKAFGAILDELAPNSLMSGQLGINMNDAATGVSKEFVSVAEHLYGHFRKLVSKNNIAMIPTTNLRKITGELSGEVRAGEIFKRTDGKPIPRLTTEKISSWIKDVDEAPDLLTMGQYRRLMEEFKDIMGQMNKFPSDVRKATMMKDAAELDLNNIRVDLLPPGVGEAIKKTLDAANLFYSKGIINFQAKNILKDKGVKVTLPEGFRGKESFETPTGQAIARIDKNVFGPGAIEPGKLNPDELSRIAVNLRSSVAISDLEGLVGRRQVRAAARHHVESSLARATEQVQVGETVIEVIDPHKFLSNLGVIGFDRGQREALQALLSRGKVRLRDLEDLAEVVGSIEGLRDTATFLQRKAIIGSAQGTLAAAGGVGGSVAFASGPRKGKILSPVLSALGITLLARRGSDIISSPRHLRNLITAIDERINSQARAQAWARLTRFVVQKEEQEEVEQRKIQERLAREVRKFSNELPVEGRSVPLAPTSEDASRMR